MSWWARAARLHLVFGATAAGGILTALTTGLALPVPSLSGDGAFAAIGSFALIAVLVTVAFWAGASAANRAAALVSVRPVWLLLTVTAAALVLLAAGFAVASSAVSEDAGAAGWLLVRDLLGFLALGFILVPWTGYRYAGVVPTLYLFVAAVFGRARGGSGDAAAFWAWPISAATGLAEWMPPLLLVAAAAAVVVLRGAARPLRSLVAQAVDPRRE